MMKDLILKVEEWLWLEVKVTWIFEDLSKKKFWGRNFLKQYLEQIFLMNRGWSVWLILKLNIKEWLNLAHRDELNPQSKFFDWHKFYCTKSILLGGAKHGDLFELILKKALFMSGKNLNNHVMTWDSNLSKYHGMTLIVNWN